MSDSVSYLGLLSVFLLGSPVRVVCVTGGWGWCLPGGGSDSGVLLGSGEGGKGRDWNTNPGPVISVSDPLTTRLEFPLFLSCAPSSSFPVED